MITMARSGPRAPTPRDRLEEVVVPIITNCLLERYPFYRDNQTRWTWHDKVRGYMVEAGIPAVLGHEDPLIVRDDGSRTVHIMWFRSSGHSADWTADKALEMCRALFRNVKTVRIEYRCDKYFCIAIEYGEQIYR